MSFGEADLAALCNSAGRLAERWGPELGRWIGRRLLELAAAADLTEIEALPGGHFHLGAAPSVTINFEPGGIELTGVLLDGRSAAVYGPGSRHQRLRLLNVTARVIEGSRVR